MEIEKTPQTVTDEEEDFESNDWSEYQPPKEKLLRRISKLWLILFAEVTLFLFLLILYMVIGPKSKPTIDGETETLPTQEVLYIHRQVLPLTQESASGEYVSNVRILARDSAGKPKPDLSIDLLIPLENNQKLEELVHEKPQAEITDVEGKAEIKIKSKVPSLNVSLRVNDTQIKRFPIDFPNGSAEYMTINLKDKPTIAGEGEPRPLTQEILYIHQQVLPLTRESSPGEYVSAVQILARDSAGKPKPDLSLELSIPLEEDQNLEDFVYEKPQPQITDTEGKAEVKIRAKVPSLNVALRVNDTQIRDFPIDFPDVSAKIDISAPDAVSFRLDGQEWQPKPENPIELWPGANIHELSLEVKPMEIASTRSSTSEVEPGKEVSGSQPINLSPKGNLFVISTPTRAEVFLDGTKKGITPLDIRDVPSGNHTLTIQKPGYHTREKGIQVKSVQPTISYQLQPFKITGVVVYDEPLQLPVPFGWIQIEGTSYKTMTDEEGDFEFSDWAEYNLPAGECELFISDNFARFGETKVKKELGNLEQDINFGTIKVARVIPPGSGNTLTTDQFDFFNNYLEKGERAIAEKKWADAIQNLNAALKFILQIAPKHTQVPITQVKNLYAHGQLAYIKGEEKEAKLLKAQTFFEKVKQSQYYDAEFYQDVEEKLSDIKRLTEKKQSVVEGG